MTASTTYQSRNQYRNPRSITPETSFDDHDLLSVNRSSSVKKTTTRSLTPDKRPLTPEQPFKSSTAKLTASQTSLMSRQSSGSRQSTLERQLQRHDESRISRSSSSSSDDVGGGVINRQSRRPPFKAMNNGDYKIRRSRWAYPFYPTLKIHHWMEINISTLIFHPNSDLFNYPSVRQVAHRCRRLWCELETQQRLNRPIQH